MKKKMKGVVSMEPPYEAYQGQKTRFRHQSLLQDYEDLHKVTPLSCPLLCFPPRLKFSVVGFSGSGFPLYVRGLLVYLGP